MRIVGLFCLAVSTTEGAKCHAKVNPYGYKTSPYSKGDADNAVDRTDVLVCPSSKGAVLVDVEAPAVVDDILDTCCDTKPLCSTMYEKNDGSDDDKQKCASEQAVVPAALKCVSSDGDSKCATAEATYSSKVDKKHCCRMMCKNTVGGFASWMKTRSDERQNCPEKGGAYKVSDTAYCASDTCGSKDQNTCCQKQCSVGFVLFADKTKVDSDEAVDTFCEEGDFQISDAHCAGPTCTDVDRAVCCQQKCSGSKEGKGFKTKTEDKTAEGTCDDTDTVHATAFCVGSPCGSTDKGTCCQESCSVGFRKEEKEVKVGSSQFCNKFTDSLADAKCAGSPCKTTDSGTCCAEKCSATFYDNKGKPSTGSSSKDSAQQKECKEPSSKVSASGTCVGACADSDEDACCEVNNSTPEGTADAHGVGLVSSVAMLVALSAAF